MVPNPNPKNINLKPKNNGSKPWPENKTLNLKNNGSKP